MDRTDKDTLETLLHNLCVAQTEVVLRICKELSFQDQNVRAAIAERNRSSGNIIGFVQYLLECERTNK